MAPERERFELERVTGALVLLALLFAGVALVIAYDGTASADEGQGIVALGALAVGSILAYAALKQAGPIELDRQGIWSAGNRDRTFVRWDEIVDIRENLLNQLTLIDREGRPRLKLSSRVVSMDRLTERLLERAALAQVDWNRRRFPSRRLSTTLDLIPFAFISLVFTQLWYSQDPVLGLLGLILLVFVVRDRVRHIRSVTLSDDKVQLRWLFRKAVIRRYEVRRVELMHERVIVRGGRAWLRHVRIHLNREKIDIRSLSGSKIDLYRALVAWRRSEATLAS